MAKKLKAKAEKSRPIITLEQKLPEVPGRDPYAPPTQHLVKDDRGGYVVEKYRRPSKTLLVDQIRGEVDQWRNKNYQALSGISLTSQRLLEWWFDETHHFENGRGFQYYFNERILTRVVPETGLVAQQELLQPDHCRLALKMATGSGKTLVMAMAVAWSYFHKKMEWYKVILNQKLTGGR